MAKHGYDKLIDLAARSSIGYGLFLGAVQAPIAPKDLAEAKDKAKFSTYIGHLGRDIGLGLFDDLTALPILMAAGKIWPKFSPISKPLVGAIGAIGGGMAGAIAAHDTVNYLEARSVVRAAGGDLNLPDYRMNAIDGFQNSGAGRVIRKQLTGISSPASQAVMRQITNNPYANLLAHFVRTPQERETGEAPERNPVRTGLSAATAIGSLTFLGAGRFGFGKATLASMAMGSAAGSWAVANSGADGNGRLQGYAAVFETALPTLAAFGGIMGLRGMSKWAGKSGVMGMLGKIGVASDKGFNRAAGYVSKVGTDYGPKAQVGLANAAEKFIASSTNSSAAFRNTSGWKNFQSKLSTWGAIRRMEGGRVNNMLADLVLQKDEITIRKEISSAPRHAIMAPANALGAVTKTTGFLGDRLIFPMLKHSGSQSSSWEQSLALGHLLAVGPHAYHATKGMITGSYDSYGIGDDSSAPTKRKRHGTSSMPSNRAAA